jgi:hypothetical protein
MHLRVGDASDQTYSLAVSLESSRRHLSTRDIDDEMVCHR